jgi:hypothetical protein
MYNKVKLLLKNSIIIILFIPLYAGLVHASEPVQGDYSGRNEFITGQTINGAIIGGTLMLGLTGDEDVVSSMTPFAGAFSGAGIGFYSTYVLTREQPYVSGEQAAFVNSVSFWSAFEGLMLGHTIFPASEKPFLISAISNAAGTMAACHLAYPSSPGKNRTAMANAAGLWGVLLGTGSYFLFCDGCGGRYYAATLLVFSAAGIGAARFWEYGDEFSPGQVAKISGIGLLGGLIGTSIMTLPLICSSRSKYWDELLLSGAIIGSVVGLVYGYNKYKDERAGGDDINTQNGASVKEQIFYFSIPVGGRW